MVTLQMTKTGGGWFHRVFGLFRDEIEIGAVEQSFVSFRRIEFNGAVYSCHGGGMSKQDSLVCSIHDQAAIEWSGLYSRTLVRDVNDGIEYKIRGSFGLFSSRVELRRNEKTVCQISFPDDAYFKAIYQSDVPDYIPFCVAVHTKNFR